MGEGGWASHVQLDYLMNGLVHLNLSQSQWLCTLHNTGANWILMRGTRSQWEEVLTLQSVLVQGIFLEF